MAEKDSGPKSSWPVPILLLVTLTGGYLFSQSPLKSFRPLHESLDTSSIYIDQQVSARLWQDPLEAVLNYKSKHNPSRQSAEEMNTRIKELISNKPSHVTVLISTLDDSPYSEGRETRIRVRYVVGAALNHACYVPENAEGIGLMSWATRKFDENPPVDLPQTRSGASVQMSDKALLLEVPFEWYRKRKVVTCTNTQQDTNSQQDQERLLVLWLKGSDIEGAPLQYLNDLVTSVVPVSSDKGSSSVSIKLLGPWGSDALRSMMKAAMKSGNSLHWSQRHVELLSPWATADPLLLLATEDESVLTSDRPLPTESRVRIASSFKEAGIEWAYSIGSDRHMLAQLGEELQRRQIHIDKAKIAVVSEWDTFYGRMLPLEFRAMALCKHRNSTYCSLDEEWRHALASSRNPDEWHNHAGKKKAGKDDALDNSALTKDAVRIDRYTYLRGLDGEMAHEERPISSKARKSQQDSIYELWKDEQSLSSLERSDGPSQYDYVRRLSAQLKSDERADDRYVAIGVLGSDPHDKLLILQALTKEFPGAVFFTTDLDARFLHPSQQGWARNLIIASPFGLSLGDTHQRDVPPFRDSYQTAAYHALITSLTIEGGDATKAAQQHALPQGCLETKCVRLFEVGRTQFVNLSQYFPEPHPGEEDYLGRGLMVLGTTFIGIVLACILLVVLRQASKRFALWSGGIGAVVLTGLALIWYCASNRQEEPFFWAEGVSIWPTELVRLLAAALTIYFIRATVRSLRERKAEIVQKYVKDLNDRDDQFDFARLWKKHDEVTNTFTIFWRVGVGLILAIALFALIFASFERPFIPARGAIGFTVDCLVLILSVSSLYVLLLLVAYLCAVCSTLLENLRTHRAGQLTGWGEDPSMNLPRATLNDWFAIRVSADYTSIFSSFAPYPLYVLLLLIISRNGYFDHWTFPTSLILAYFIMFGLLAFSSMKLWSCGSTLRREVIASLREGLATAQRHRDTILAARIETIIEEVGNLKKGVYGSWKDQPIWHTVLYPLGGVTILSFLDFMAGR